MRSVKRMDDNYDVAIIGGGITGTALAYILSKYTTIKKIVLIEKCSSIAQVNSRTSSNSQTLHFGDIETNYTKEKAVIVRDGAQMVKRFVEQHRAINQKLYRKTKKMVIAVGSAECAQLEQRYAEIKQLFPKLQRLNNDAIAKIEPSLTEGRKEELLALCSDDGYAINYQKLAETFVCEGRAETLLNTTVKKITKSDTYHIKTERGIIDAAVIVVSAGAYSLHFAQMLGYGKEYALFPCAGDFYYGKNLLKNKVYTFQIKGIPFAAVHGDPDVEHPEITRFGPTALVVPWLEKRNILSALYLLPYLRWRTIKTLIKALKEKGLRKFILRNFRYYLPFGKYAYIKALRKIIPNLKGSDIKKDKTAGGLRPQVMDIVKQKLVMGEVKITGDNIIFNITPSPGASICLKNAEQDAIDIIRFFGKYKLNHEQLKKDLH